MNPVQLAPITWFMSFLQNLHRSILPVSSFIQALSILSNSSMYHPCIILLILVHTARNPGVYQNKTRVPGNSPTLSRFLLTSRSRSIHLFLTILQSSCQSHPLKSVASCYSFKPYYCSMAWIIATRTKHLCL